jgi:hypothetical protein
MFVRNNEVEELVMPLSLPYEAIPRNDFSPPNIALIFSTTQF